MSLTNITNTTTIYNTGPTAAQPGYTDLLTEIAKILGESSNGYGYPGHASIALTENDLIRAEHWNSIVTDLNVIWQHQNDVELTFENAPKSGDIVNTAFANQLINLINDANNRKYNRPPEAQRSSSSNASSVNTTWGTTLEHSVELRWDSLNDMNYFFNLGGRISFNLDCDQGSQTGNNATWKTFINNVKSGISLWIYDRARFKERSVFPTTTSTTFTNGSDSIVLTATKSANRYLELDLKINNSLSGVTLVTTSTFVTEYSTGAINAPRPDINQAPYTPHTFGDVYSAIFEPSKKLDVVDTYVNPYSWESRIGSSSVSHVINITNIGNTATTILSIDFSTNGGVTAIPTYSWSFPKVINSGTTVNFLLAYTGNTVGFASNSMTILTDSTTQPIITKPTNQTVKPKLFSFTVSPSSIVYSTTSSSVLEQKFTIVPSDGTYTALPASSLSSGVGYTIIKQEQTGPTVQFNGSTNTTFNTTLSVIATGTNSVNEITTVTKTVSISVSRNAAETKNIGTWISALQPSNGVIGVSYDMIDGMKYITIGFGAGADGAGSVENDVPSRSLLDVRNLGTNTNTLSVDNKYAIGNPPLYPVITDTGYTQFLWSVDDTSGAGYGTWIRPSVGATAFVDGDGAYGPRDIGVSRTYTFTAPVDGTYTWEHASDDDSYFTIDGALWGDLRTGFSSSNWQTSHTGSKYLAAGQHTLTFYVVNGANQGRFGLKIVSPTNQEVWSTRVPVRSDSITSPPYKNWQEVYRIPLTGIAQTYQCNDTYCIKNSNRVNGQRWGYYFGSVGSTANSMFTVTDDGNGNIGIAMNTVDVNSAEMITLSNVDTDSYNTIVNATHLFYYFSFIRAGLGYTQLPDGTTAPAADGTTPYFIGFTQQGDVRTTDVIPPTDPTNTISNQGGGSSNEFFSVVLI